MNGVAQWLENYKNVADVEGWMSVEMLDLLKVLHEMTEKIGGGALEIGVHHGKFFLACNAITEYSDKSVALDVFEDQYLNIDYSGNGNKEKFISNVRKYGRHGESNTVIISGDSLNFTAADILSKTDGVKFKIVSIDGGHTAEHTISDIELASQVVNDFGFIVVDDFLNSHWLGVIDGVTAFLRSRPKIWPLATAFNKLIMCKMSIHGIYSKQLAEKYKFTKTTQLCGYDILSV